jgi:hypothetical protein
LCHASASEETSSFGGVFSPLRRKNHAKEIPNWRLTLQTIPVRLPLAKIEHLKILANGPEILNQQPLKVIPVES